MSDTTSLVEQLRKRLQDRKRAFHQTQPEAEVETAEQREARLMQDESAWSSAGGQQRGILPAGVSIL